jgi:hypothetical protein
VVELAAISRPPSFFQLPGHVPHGVEVALYELEEIGIRHPDGDGVVEVRDIIYHLQEDEQEFPPRFQGNLQRSSLASG